MDDLIEALTILRKYSDTKWPTHCQHDVLTVCVDPDTVSGEDKAWLEELGFHVGDASGEMGFDSFRFGSC